MQTPDSMEGEARTDGGFAYLMQFLDGSRIDLTLFPEANLANLPPDSLSKTLLDKDGLLPPFPEPDESSYLPTPPTPRQFAECCNEFWWVTPMLPKVFGAASRCMPQHAGCHLRSSWMKMLVWYVVSARV